MEGTRPLHKHAIWHEETANVMLSYERGQTTHTPVNLPSESLTFKSPQAEETHGTVPSASPQKIPSLIPPGFAIMIVMSLADPR
jgi:subtilase family serine protease